MADRHKVFISYYHADDQAYKNALIGMRGWNPDTGRMESVFEDYSVRENDIDDRRLTDEEIRKIIRDDYMKEATVMVLLCGKNSWKRKFIDWETHAAMYDSEANPKMGILVVNLPSIEAAQSTLMIRRGAKIVIDPHGGRRPIDGMTDREIDEAFLYLPRRVSKNIRRADVNIPVVNWSGICIGPETVKKAVDYAFHYKYANNYDHSDRLRRQNYRG